MRYFGQIGFACSEKEGPGIYKERIEEHEYYGDVNSDRRTRQSSDQVNDNLDFSTEISIVGDEFAFRHFSWIKYAHWMGEKWDVRSVRPKYPRLILTLGGLYHETGRPAN